jgi:hypothetical protein
LKSMGADGLWLKLTIAGLAIQHVLAM